MRFLAVAAAVLASSCATMSPDECRLADWKAQGLSDALSGATNTRYSSHVSACAKANILPDAEAYQAGRAEGLKTFCTAANGFQHGLSGGGAITDCPADQAAAFSEAYTAGAFAHRVVQRVESLESDVSSLRARWRDVEDKLRANEIGFDASKTPEERDRHLSEIRRLRSELRRIDRDIHERENELFWARGELWRARADIGPRWGW
jgi:hypothetical protein